MGNVINKLGSVSQSVRGRKRKREDESNDEGGDGSDLLDKSLQTPKRKKLVSTAKYIYQALFKEERNSDVTVHALGKQWHLHKVYLSQSPYFASMFGGSWRESDEDYVHIEIIDPKITIESLYSVFGSLYMDEVVLDPKEIVSTLATATLFQLDSLIDRCAEWLRLISFELMEQLASSADLYVVQTEFTVYTLLRYWMALKLFPDESPTDGVEHPKERYFSERTSTVPFLCTAEGAPYERVFRALRLPNLLNHHVDIRVLRQDNIIPLEWLHKPLLQQWNSVLTIDQSLDKLIECDDRVFLASCIRCGRILNENVLHKWRWTGFHFGLDLLLSSDTRSLRIRRHHRTEHERLLSLRVTRQFLVRVSLASLNELRQIKHQQTTPILSIALEKNEETQLVVFDRELTFPLLVSVNMMLVAPSEEALATSKTTTVEKEVTATTNDRSTHRSVDAGNSNGTVESLDGGSPSSSSNRMLANES
uniref:BTB domain-containing protein n=1 Tax=Anopheles minimus TaxID=112268 RepID=A0A182WEH6_9DIPT